MNGGDGFGGHGGGPHDAGGHHGGTHHHGPHPGGTHSGAGDAHRPADGVPPGADRRPFLPSPPWRSGSGSDRMSVLAVVGVVLLYTVPVAVGLLLALRHG